MLEMTLPPGLTPLLQAYRRSDGVAQGGSITGSAVAGRSTLYRFDLASLPDGDYSCDITNPLGRVYVRKAGSAVTDAGSWVDLDLVVRVAAAPAYGDTQRWDTGVNQMNVTVTKV